MGGAVIGSSRCKKKQNTVFCLLFKKCLVQNIQLLFFIFRVNAIILSLTYQKYLLGRIYKAIMD